MKTKRIEKYLFKIHLKENDKFFHRIHKNKRYRSKKRINYFITVFKNINKEKVDLIDYKLYKHNYKLIKKELKHFPTFVHLH